MRKGERTNQKYRKLVGSDQQMQKLEETELRKADRTIYGSIIPIGFSRFEDEEYSSCFTAGRPRKLEGSAEHLIDGSEKRICQLSFEF